MRQLGRQKHKSSRNKTTNYFYSYKAGLHLWCEGISEKETCIIFEFSDQILTYRDQESTFVLKDQCGKEFTYTPDFIAFDLTKYDHVIVESKTKDYPMSEDEIQLLRWAFKTQYNKHFIHFVPSEHCSEVCFQNYKLLLNYLKLSPTQIISLQTVKMLCGDALPFRDFRSVLLKHNIDDTFAFAYLAHRLATFNLDEPLCDTTVVEFV